MIKDIKNSAIIIKIRNLIGKNKIKIGKGNSFICNLCLLKKCFVNVNGIGNRIIIEMNSKLNNCTFFIRGNNNLIHIKENCIIRDANFWMEDNDNIIEIGKATSIHGKTNLATIESTKIIIGEECMFSSDISFRTGDSHSILDLNGNRINPSKDIEVGKHCWIGTKVICLKGTKIADNCIVGAGSLLSGEYHKKNCIWGGVPAKCIKERIDWRSERI